MKIRTTSNAPGYVRKFQRVLVASAIATFLGACAGGTGEETGNGATSGTTPDIGAAVEATVDTDTDLVVPGSGSGVELTPGTDSASVGSVVDISEVAQTDIEVDSTTDTVEIPEVDSTTDTVEIPEVDSTTDTVEIPEVESTNSVPDNALGLIQSHPGLGLFATAIQSTVLATFLADPNQSVTVFALSDKAFQSLSTTQRDSLFEDTTRLETLIKATTILDRRIAENSAGVVDDMQALTNGKMKLVLEGDVMSVATDNSSFMKGSVEIVDSLENNEAVIHVIDDFINIDATFFPPDPGSIMDRLLTDQASTVSNRIRYTRWYRELGNSEGEWTVFAPLYSVNLYDIEPYIVPGTVNDPIIGEAGAFTSVDGSSHVIENVDGALTIDNIDISEINALQVNNGHVHRIVWQLGEENYISVQDLLEQYDSYTSYNVDSEPENPDGSNNYVRRQYSISLRFEFFENLIVSLNEMERYDDRSNRLTLIIPEFAETAAEEQQRITEHRYYGSRTMYDAFDYMRSNDSFSMVPDIFPDIDSARNFLLSHTIAGIVTEKTLDDNLGGQLQTAAGTTLVLTEESINGSTNIYLGGQLLGPSINRVPAANGGIISSATALAETPDFSGWGNSSGVFPSTSAAALIGDGTAYSGAGEAFVSSFSYSLDNTNGNTDTFMFFVPSNPAMIAASLTTADVTLPVQQRHIQTSVTALEDGGTVATVGSEGGTHAVAADGSGGFTVGGFPVILLATTPERGEIYGIEGILP